MRDDQWLDPEPAPEPERPDPSGRLRTTGPGVLVGCFVVGLVLGWLIRPVAVRLDLTAPQITWIQGAALYFVAAVLAWVARATHTAVQQRRRGLRPHEAVNRLVLAKSCALAGAAVAGGYLGYALSWVGISAHLAGERIVMSLFAAGGGALTVVASLFVERACRIRDGDEQP